MRIMEKELLKDLWVEWNHRCDVTHRRIVPSTHKKDAA